MNKIIAAAIVILSVCFLFAVQGSQRTCTRVVDGDTIILDGNEKVRLIGIDAPETQDPRKPVQYFGQECAAFLKKLIEGKQVRLEYDQERLDKYGRTLAYVYLLDGTFINARMVETGYALAYIKYPFKYLENFLKIERGAREQALGLWGSPSTTTVASTATVATTQSQTNQGEIVYITRTGKKYHRETCSSLRKSKTAISLGDACAQGYGPCSRCNPPSCK